jgi:hypothetical protein
MFPKALTECKSIPMEHRGEPDPERSLPGGVADFLASHREMTLFCRRRDGRPVGYPMTVFGHGAREVLFTTYRKSTKVRHLAADPRVCLLSFRPDGEHGVRWVTMSGTAEIWSPGPGDVERLMGGRAGGDGTGSEDTGGEGPGSEGTGGEGPGADGVVGDGRVPSVVTERVKERLLDGKRIIVRVVLDDPGAC